MGAHLQSRAQNPGEVLPALSGKKDEPSNRIFLPRLLAARVIYLSRHRLSGQMGVWSCRSDTRRAAQRTRYRFPQGSWCAKFSTLTVCPYLLQCQHATSIPGLSGLKRRNGQDGSK